VILLGVLEIENCFCIVSKQRNCLLYLSVCMSVYVSVYVSVLECECAYSVAIS